MSKTSTKRVGTVTAKEFLSPHLIRIKLKVDNIHELEHATVGDNNKILIPPTGVDKIHFPKKDPTTQLWMPVPESQAPIKRTYTHSGIDLKRSELLIDFVYHGNHGPASAWAGNCEVGDILGIMMRTQPKQLFPSVNNYLLIGDATALPAIAAILKQLPEAVKAICVLEVHGKEDELELHSRATTNTIWLHNPRPSDGSQLSNKVKELSLPAKSRFAFVAAEYRTVKELRKYLRKEMEWTPDEISAYSYWRAGLAENLSELERREEKNGPLA